LFFGPDIDWRCLAHLIWQRVREDLGVVWIVAGIAAIGACRFVATLQEDNQVRPILAAYGWIFVAGSLTWGIRRRLPSLPMGLHRRGDLPRRGRPCILSYREHLGSATPLMA
jgi:Uncharacterised BCR, YnfA/UPF0060 family